MNYWRKKMLNHSKFNRIGLATFLTAMVGIMGFVPLQVYALTTPPRGSLEVGSSTSGSCAQASGETAGSSVVLSACNGQINQKWYINRAGYYNGQIAYDIETAKAGSFQCLNDVNNSTAHAAPVNLASCNGIISAQRFVYVNNSGSGNELFNIASKECLDSSTLGSQLVQNPCTDGTGSQLWFLTPNSAKP